MQDASEAGVGHMSPEEFRRAGRAVVDWVADYLERVESFPVRSRAAPGEVRAKLPAAPPRHGEPFEAVLRDLDEIVLPGITHWQSPNFFAYFPSNASPSAILGEIVSAGLGVQGMSWQTSPACTELETHLLDWFVELLGLPREFLSSGPGGGVIQDTASSAALCALLAARERAGGGDRLVAYASDQAHSSVEKAARIAGLARERMRAVPSDERFALRPDALVAAVAADRAAGLRPFFLCASVGTTSSTAIDPVARLAPIAREAGMWLHVDAAMAGSAAICPELRGMQAGVEHADSYCFNPHKGLLVNFDCDLFWVRDRAALLAALSILPEYLRTKAGESGAVIDYRDWQIPLGRRFRALKLWFVLRHYGVEGLRAHVRGYVARAAEFARWVEADPRFELAAPVTFNLVCFRLRGDDARNEALMERLNASGALYLTHTRLAGRTVLRMAFGGTWTERRHVEAAWRAIRSAAPAD
jgi:aromatic-L-amino-acid decarboxylase